MPHASKLPLQNRQARKLTTEACCCVLGCVLADGIGSLQRLNVRATCNSVSGEWNMPGKDLLPPASEACAEQDLQRLVPGFLQSHGNCGHCAT